MKRIIIGVYFACRKLSQGTGLSAGGRGEESESEKVRDLQEKLDKMSEQLQNQERGGQGQESQGQARATGSGQCVL